MDTWMTAILGGLAVGALLGALGAGGSMVTLPLFAFGFQMPIHQATTASMWVVASVAGTSAFSHWKDNQVHVRPAIGLSVAAGVGAYVGAYALHYAQKETFLLGFSGLLLVGAWALWSVPSSAVEVAPTVNANAFRWVRVVGLGLTVGFLTGFFGVGGGFLIVPALVVGLGLPMREAVGTSLWVVTTSALTGLLSNVHEALPWGQVLPFALAGAAGALFGQKMAKQVDTTWLRRSFALALLALAVFLVFTSKKTSS